MSEFKWFSSKEKLPEKSGMYAVYVRDPYYGTSAPGPFLEYDTSYVDCAYYDKSAGLWRTDSVEYYCAHLENVNIKETYYISHWTNLPDPPSKESN